jgi:MFS family permease
LTKKNFLISIFTVFVQYYDYHLFGFLAANIALHFFPAEGGVTQLLKTYFVMAAAVIAKPIGALIFGKIGDRKGRSNSFKISLFGTATASLILFATPSYEMVGIISVFTLLLCRMAICAFVSSGSDGVRLYIYEHLDKSRRCLGIGVTSLFTYAGSLAASLSTWFFTLNYLPDYSWKFTFLLGAFLGFVLVLIMKTTNFSDTQEIKEVKNFNEFQNLPLTKIIKSNRSLFFWCVILAGSIGSVNQFLIIFFGTYNFEILRIIPRSLMQQYTSLAIIFYMIFSVIGGGLADRLGPYLVLKISVVITLILSIILCVQVNNLVFDGFVFLAISCFVSLITIPAAALLKQSIPIAIRYRFFALAHAAGSIVISAPTAFLLTLIYYKTNISWLPVVYFIITVIMIFCAASYLNKNNRLNEHKDTIK